MNIAIRFPSLRHALYPQTTPTPCFTPLLLSPKIGRERKRRKSDTIRSQVKKKRGELKTRTNRQKGVETKL